MSVNGQTIRLLLVDDHPVVTEGLSLLLARFDDMDIVGMANGGAAAIAEVEALRPDIVLMDLSMPEIDGVEATRQIRSAHPDVKVLALTAFMEQRLVAGAMEAGASGYLLKSVGSDELATAIRTVASGGSILSAQALELLVAPSNLDRIGDDLTPREIDTLALLVHGLSNKQIARKLELAPGTVRIYVSNILTKLHVENRTGAAYVARNQRLVDVDAGAETDQNR